MQNDRRRHPRREMVLRAQTLGSGGRHDVTCINAGPGGGYFAAKVQPEVGDSVELALRPPGEKTPAVVMTGRVIHVQGTTGVRAPGFAVQWMTARSAVGGAPIVQLLTRAFGVDPARIALHTSDREAMFDFAKLDGRSTVPTVATSERVDATRPPVAWPASRPSGRLEAASVAQSGERSPVPARSQPPYREITGAFGRTDRPSPSAAYRAEGPRVQVPPPQEPPPADVMPYAAAVATPVRQDSRVGDPSPRPAMGWSGAHSTGLGWSAPPPVAPEAGSRAPIAVPGRNTGPVLHADLGPKAMPSYPAPQSAQVAPSYPATAAPSGYSAPAPVGNYPPQQPAAVPQAQLYPYQPQADVGSSPGSPASLPTPRAWMPEAESMSPFVAHRSAPSSRQPAIALRSPVPVPPPSPIPAVPLDPAGAWAQKQGYKMATSPLPRPPAQAETGPLPVPSRSQAPDPALRLEAPAEPGGWPAGVPTVLAERYANLVAIGRGASGVVYHAHDELLDRQVVLKFLVSSSMADEVAKRYFVREVKVASQLRHPNIVLIHDIGKVEGLLYYAMEWVDGQTLGRYLKPRTPVADGAFIWSVVHQVADALDYAHSQSVLHRDVKPDNVMVTRDGLCKLVDFGLARRQHEDFGERTLLVGTPHYMAPEQLSGKAVGPAADQYALGIIVYRMLTGFLPFGDSNVFVAHLTEMPRDPRQLNPRVPPLAVAVVERMLAKRPEERYPNCAEAAQALRWALLPP